MLKLRLSCFVVVMILVTEGFSVPQGRFRARQQQRQEAVNQQPAHNLDPTNAEEGMNNEHAKLIENLQRLKRTLESVQTHVKERVAKGTYGEQTQVDMKNPEGAILTVLKSLQEQGQLFAMINDMLKAGSEVQSHTDKIQAYSKVQEHARAESSLPQHTSHIGIPPSSPSALPPTAHSAPSHIPSVGPTAPQFTRGAGSRSTTQTSKQNYNSDDYSYQYRDDSADSTGAEQYDYHYDVQGYEPNKRPYTTEPPTTTTKRAPPQRRLRGRITSRNDYF